MTLTVYDKNSVSIVFKESGDIGLGYAYRLSVIDETEGNESCVYLDEEQLRDLAKTIIAALERE